MTKAEKQAISNAFENCINRENQFCDRYIELNPTDKASRSRDRDLVIQGIQLMYSEIIKQLEV